MGFHSLLPWRSLECSSKRWAWLVLIYFIYHFPICIYKWHTMNIYNCLLYRVDDNVVLKVSKAFIFPWCFVAFACTWTWASSILVLVPCGRGKQTIRLALYLYVLNVIDVSEVLVYIKVNGTFMCVLLLLQRSDSCAEWRVETELLRSHRLRRQLTTQHLLPSHPKVGYNILCIASLLPFISFPQSLVPKSLSAVFFPPKQLFYEVSLNKNH